MYIGRKEFVDVLNTINKLKRKYGYMDCLFMILSDIKSHIFLQ